MADLKKTLVDAERAPNGVPWKAARALRLRTAVAARHHWMAQAPKMGAPSSVRAYIPQAD